MSGKGEIQHCDICWGKSTRKGLTFRQCTVCKVGIHDECYGVETDPGEHFRCLACEAVGTTVKARHGAQKQVVEIKERPTKCVLCTVDHGMEWVHAMHPIYDRHTDVQGPCGRPLLLPDGRTTAWAHTLCCQTISSSLGTVYGCGQDGCYHDQQDDDQKVYQDEVSVNSQANTETAWDGVRHFVHMLGAEQEGIWAKAAKEQRELKCYLCGDTGSPFALPVQCCANDSKEFNAFRHLHRNLGDSTCFEAAHVGCLAWGHDETPTFRRVYFFPGGRQDVPNSVACAYCDTHGMDLVNASVGGSTTIRYPNGWVKSKSKCPPAQSSLPPPEIDTSLARKVERRGRQRFTEAKRPEAISDARGRLGLRDPYRDRLVSRKRPRVEEPDLGSDYSDEAEFE